MYTHTVHVLKCREMDVKFNALELSKCSKLRKMIQNAQKCVKKHRNAVKFIKRQIRKIHINALE